MPDVVPSPGEEGRCRRWDAEVFDELLAAGVPPAELPFSCWPPSRLTGAGE